jgi:hypothetical protein
VTRPYDASLALAALCAVAFACLWLFGLPFDSQTLTLEPPRGYEQMKFADGAVKEVEDRKIVLRPFRRVDGRRELEFAIAKDDAPRFDMAHLRAHSAIGVPTRIYFERRGALYFARWKTDAPVNSAR